MSGRRASLLDRLEAATIFWVARNWMPALALMVAGAYLVLRGVWIAANYALDLILWAVSVW